VSALDLFQKHIVQKNEAVEEFILAAMKVQKSIEKETFAGRSPVRKEGNMYKFELLGETLAIDGDQSTLNVLKRFITAARDESDTPFRQMIEQAYAGSSKTVKPARATRKVKLD
jgi:hypothetical protein